MAMWDLMKCYEDVQHGLLEQEAARAVFPRALLRTELASYGWRRVIRLEDIVAPRCGRPSASSPGRLGPRTGPRA